jgi:hypothetical protein
MSLEKGELEASKEICFEETTDSLSSGKKLRIIHFNDVYNIESRDVEPVGGCEFFFIVFYLKLIYSFQIAPRFIELLEYLMKDEPALVLFSGDAFSPSNCISNF